MVNAEYIKTIDTTFENGKHSVLQFNALPRFDLEQYDFYNDKDYAKFIKDTERVVRTSYEYRTLINYLRTSEGMNQCTFLSNITNADSPKIGIEIHHTPFTLWDICSTVIRKRLHLNESHNIFDISKEVLWLHYAGYVGLIPVCTTAHEIIHNQYMVVPTNIIRGNYTMFINEYSQFIDPDTMDALNTVEQLTQQYLSDPSGNNIIAKQMDIFNHHATYINIASIPKTARNINGLSDIIRARINQIKSGEPKQLLYTLINPKE